MSSNLRSIINGILVLSVLTSLALFSTVHAESALLSTPTIKVDKDKQNVINARKKASTIKDELAKARCEKATIKVSEIEDKITAVKERNNFKGLIAKFEKISSLLREKNIDTINLDKDIIQLKSLIATGRDNTSTAVAALKKTEEIQCRDKKTEDIGFTSAFTQTKKNIEEMNKIVKENSREISLQMKKIRNDLAQIRFSLKSKTEKEIKVSPISSKGTSQITPKPKDIDKLID